MKKYLLIPFLFLCLLVSSLNAQQIYPIRADSVRIFKEDCNAELIIENGTRFEKGFLFNRGNGRTEFRRALIKIDDSTYLIGGDTLNLGFEPGGKLLSKLSDVNLSALLNNQLIRYNASTGKWVNFTPDYLTPSSGVTTISGTLNNISVNGGLAAQSGAITLSLPSTVTTNIFNAANSFNSSGTINAAGKITGASFGISATPANSTGAYELLTRNISTGLVEKITSIPNSALTNSSLSFAIGTSGTAPNWTTSPVSLGGSAILNIPLAGSSITSGTINNTTQTIYGVKTFNSDLVGSQNITAVSSVFAGLLAQAAYLYAIGVPANSESGSLSLKRNLGGSIITTNPSIIYSNSDSTWNFDYYYNNNASSRNFKFVVSEITGGRRALTIPDTDGTIALGTGTASSLTKWSSTNSLTNAVAGTDYQLPYLRRVGTDLLPVTLGDGLLFTGSIVGGTVIGNTNMQTPIMIVSGDAGVISFSNTGGGFATSLTHSVATGTRSIALPDASGTIALTNQLPTSGTYTPTIGSQTNFTSLSLASAFYSVVGNKVDVNASFNVQHTSNSTSTSFTLTLPAGNISGFSVSGSGAQRYNPNAVSVTFNSGSTVLVEFTSASLALTNTLGIQFSYYK
jgi:hypothetical protein